jgi:hypothetical protein
MLQLAKVHPIKNNIHVVTCNCTGLEEALALVATYCGMSQVIEPSLIRVGWLGKGAISTSTFDITNK